MVDLVLLRDYLSRLSKEMPYGEIAKRLGLGYHTVYQITKGKQTNPRYSTMKVIEKAMMEDINNGR